MARGVGMPRGLKKMEVDYVTMPVMEVCSRVVSGSKYKLFSSSDGSVAHPTNEN